MQEEAGAGQSTLSKSRWPFNRTQDTARESEGGAELEGSGDCAHALATVATSATAPCIMVPRGDQCQDKSC